MFSARRLTKVGRLPRSRRQHVGCQIRLLLDNLQRKLGSLGNLEGNDLCGGDELSLLQVGNNLAVVRLGLLDEAELRSRYVFNRVDLDRAGLDHVADSLLYPLSPTKTNQRNKLVVILLDPLLPKGLSLANLGNILVADCGLQV